MSWKTQNLNHHVQQVMGAVREPPPQACGLEHNKLQLGKRTSQHKLQEGVGAVEKVGDTGSYWRVQGVAIL